MPVEQKEERIKTCSNFTATIHQESKVFLKRIITMAENMVSSTHLKPK